MKTAGIVLIILQVLALIGMAINGSMTEAGLAEWIGALSFGIIGVILLAVGINKEKQNSEKTESKDSTKEDQE